MNLDKPMQQEIFLKNILTLLATDKTVKITEKKSFVNSVRELNIPTETLGQWTNAWKQAPKSLYLPGDAKDVQDMVLYLYSALLSDENLVQSGMELLLAEFTKASLDKKKALDLIAQRTSLQSEKSFQKRAESIRDKLVVSTKPKTSSSSSSDKKFYVANQVSYEGLDEL